jgi:hypothetical protein
MSLTRSRSIRRRIAIGWLPALLFFVLGGSMAGCGSSAVAPQVTYAPPPAATATATAPVSPGSGGGTATGHTMGHAMLTAAEVKAAMAARPDYVLAASARTQEAYAFAIARPDVLDWLPCYCGCVAMDHRNNTDCYLKPRENGMPVDFDEHASYCGVCVDITLMAKSMTAEGVPLADIRTTVDAQFGAIAPGTDTPLPAN